jgi:hypothetical protein
MITFLAFIVAAKINTVEPKIVQVFESPDKCLLVAKNQNQDPRLNTAKAIKDGAMFICLRQQDFSL